MARVREAPAPCYLTLDFAHSGILFPFAISPRNEIVGRAVPLACLLRFYQLTCIWSRTEGRPLVASGLHRTARQQRRALMPHLQPDITMTTRLVLTQLLTKWTSLSARHFLNILPTTHSSGNTPAHARTHAI